jgi:hypothetical protein
MRFFWPRCTRLSKPPYWISRCDPVLPFSIANSCNDQPQTPPSPAAVPVCHHHSLPATCQRPGPSRNTAALFATRKAY